MTGTKKD